jgi:hypothetical protein
MKIKLLFVVVLVALLAMGGLPVFGQGSPAVLKDVQIENQFPKGVLFKASAEIAAPDKITEVRLDMRVKGSNRSSYDYLVITPGQAVEGSYLLRADGAQYKPPGTLIEYFFTIMDSAGRTLETPKETYLYLDNRFKWESVSEGMAEVYYYGGANEKDTAEVVLQSAVQTIDKMGKLYAVTPAQPYRIIVYKNPADMSSALPFQSEVMEQELIIEGQAWYEYGLLLMLGGDEHPDGVASHEMTHMLLSEATKNIYVNIPVWFNEGMAEYGNINPGASYDILLEQAIENGTLLPLRHMQAYPGRSEQTLLVYGQGRAVVKFMIETYGGDKIKEVVAAFKKGLRIDGALKAVYGFDQDGLDNAWRASRGLPPVEPQASEPPAPSPQPAPVPAPVTPAPQPEPEPAKKGIFSCAGP